ncbi:MAG: hypothetical protein V3S24_05990, partial [Candidatus Tectomicrobia bacterium]
NLPAIFLPLCNINAIYWRINRGGSYLIKHRPLAAHLAHAYCRTPSGSSSGALQSQAWRNVSS